MIGLLMLLVLVAGLTGCSGSTADTEVVAVDPATTKARIFFIMRNDDGAAGEKVGCGDSLIPQDMATTLAETSMEDVLNAQLAVHEESVGDQGLYNPLSRSTLTLTSVEVDEEGTAYVDFAGDLVGGTICDQLRIRAQLSQCLWQFDNVKDIMMTLDGEDFQTALTRAPSPESLQ